MGSVTPSCVTSGSMVTSLSLSFLLCKTDLIQKFGETVLPCWPILHPRLLSVRSILPPGLCTCCFCAQNALFQDILWFISSSDSQLTCRSSQRAAVGPLGWGEQPHSTTPPGSVFTAVTSGINWSCISLLVTVCANVSSMRAGCSLILFTALSPVPGTVLET